VINLFTVELAYSTQVDVSCSPWRCRRVTPVQFRGRAAAPPSSLVRARRPQLLADLGHSDPVTASAFLPLVELEEKERDGHLYRTPTAKLLKETVPYWKVSLRNDGRVRVARHVVEDN